MANTYPDSPPPRTTDSGRPAQDECTMAMLCHLLAIPTGFLGPLIIWLLKKDTMPFVDDQGKEALNFQITMIIATSVAALSMFIFIGCVLLPALVVANLVLCIMATLKANEGVRYRYPVALRLVK